MQEPSRDTTGKDIPEGKRSGCSLENGQTGTSSERVAGTPKSSKRRAVARNGSRNAAESTYKLRQRLATCLKKSRNESRGKPNGRRKEDQAGEVIKSLCIKIGLLLLALLSVPGVQEVIVAFMTKLLSNGEK